MNKEAKILATILLTILYAGCVTGPYTAHDVTPEQTRSFEVANAECEMVRLGYQTSPKHGESGLAHNDNFSEKDKAVFSSLALVEISFQAKKMYNLCMRTKGWQQ